MWTPRKRFVKILILFLKNLKKFYTMFFSSEVLKTMFFFFGLIQKQISSDAIYLYFIHLKILQWILKAWESFCLRWYICN